MKYLNLVLVLLLSIVFNSNAATISSKSSGGEWIKTSTWVGGTIPSSSDDVIINGTVSGGGTCNNLTVSSSSTLQNRPGYGETIAVYGNITNNGTIQDAGGGNLRLNLYGLITNNNIWKNYSIYLYQNGNAYFHQSSGKYFESININAVSGKADSLVMTSNVTFKTCTYGFTGTNRRVFHSNGYRLDFTACTINTFNFYTNDEVNLDKSEVLNCTFNGDGKISGVINLRSGTTFKGNLTITGTIWNTSGYGVTIYFKGKIINKGIIADQPGGSLTVYIDGDFINEGVYEPLYTHFKAGNSHIISQSKGKFFEGNFFNQGADTIILGTDLVFRKATFKGNSGTNIGVIKTTGYALTFDTSFVDATTLLSNDTINLNVSNFRQGGIYGNVVTTGVFDLNGSPNFEGSITNLGTIFNSAGYGITLNISGELINYGTISRNPNGGSLFLNLDANVTNYGVYWPSSSILKGPQMRTFSQNDTSIFQGDFYTEDTSGGIILGSNVKFKNAYVNWINMYPYSALITNGFNLDITGCEVKQVRFICKDTLSLDNSLLTNIRTYKTPTLKGKVIFHSNIVIKEGIINIDTIYQNPGYGIETNFYGKLTNKGTIMQNPNGGSFRVNLFDEMYNSGKYQPTHTYFSGTKPILMSQSPNAKYEGQYFAADTSNGISLVSDITFFKASFNGTNTAPFASFTTNGFQLTLDSSSITEMRLISNDTVNCDGSIFTNLHTYKTPTLTGLITLHSGTVFMAGCVITDTIQNNRGYGITFTTYGLFTNNGVVRISPYGGTLTADLNADLHNNGIYHPNYTYVSGGAKRQFSQEKNTTFEGTYYANDTADGIILGSDVHFKKTEINWHDNRPLSTINTNSYTLKLDSSYIHEVHIVESDTLDLNGSNLYNCEISGTPIVRGILTLSSYVTFNSTVTNIGTIQNNAGYGITTTFKSDLINEAYVKTHPNGGSFTVNLFGDLTNNAIFEPNYVNFLGSESRTIGGANVKMLKGTYTVQDTMSFSKENYLPNLNIASPNVLTIDTSSSLICDAINANAHRLITNNGRITSKIASNSWSTFYYHNATVRYHNVDISHLTVESFGAQQHPATANAVEMWWRLKPTPSYVTDSLKELNLSYYESALNGNNEEDLRVYFSPNAGLSWMKIEKDISIDTTSNTVTILNAPSYGHYVLSSNDLGIISFKPLIHRAEPRVFGNKGNVTIYGFGIGLTNSMKVTLKKPGSPDIIADTSYLTDAIGESFIAKFNINLAAVGAYSLLIEIAGEDDVVLIDYFTVEEAERPTPWVMLSGRDRFLINRWQTFHINYGNLSNVDAQGVPLFFVVNDIAGMEVDFPDVQIGVPQSFTDDGWDQWKDTTIDLYYISDSLTGFEGQNMRIYPFYIPSIGALSANSVRVKIKAPSDIEMTVWVTDPLIEGFEKHKKASTPPEVAACLTKAAAKYSWDKVIDLIPGYDCYKLAYKVTETGVSHIIKGPNEPEKPATWGSWLISGWGWAWSVADCAGDLIPVTKGVKIAKDLIGIGFDIKSNYDATQECWEKFGPKSKGKHKSRGVTSLDPNEITGPDGYTPNNYIGANTNMVYTVYFENKDSAKAPATDVLVLDTINPTQFNFATFSFNSVTIADSTYKVQAFSKAFSLLVDLAPRINTIVQIQGTLDTSNGAIAVVYRTLDRSTLELNEDVDLGFLPPNKSKPEGEGNFSYSVALKSSINHDAEITNKALIFFDANKPIATNVHSNLIDLRSPESAVISLASTTTDSTFVVSWSGTDEGCGIQTYSVFVAINDSAFVAWKSNTSSTTDTFFGHDKYNYKFYSIASDSLGLSELAPDVADTETDVLDKSGIDQITKSNSIAVYPNPVKDYISIELKENATATANVYSIDGRFIQTMELTDKITQMRVGGLESNFYIIEVISSDGLLRKKIQIME